ncbi:hypothetical protein PMAYCL1PPCAC_13935, partial [Pristionchus mayeri]
FRTHSAGSWVNHLTYRHSTTPVQAGYSLRCDCGHVTHSFDHSYKCKISNFTMIRDDENVNRRLSYDMATKVAQGFPSGKVEYSNMKQDTSDIAQVEKGRRNNAKVMKDYLYSLDWEIEPSLKNPKSEF